MIALRRDLHKHPESGWKEFYTTAKLIQLLEQNRIPVKYGHEILNKQYLWAYPSESELQAAIDQALDQGADPEISRGIKAQDEESSSRPGLRGSRTLPRRNVGPRRVSESLERLT